MRTYCNIRTATHCPKCGAEIRIGNSIASEATCGGVHEYAGDNWVVVKGCDHLAVTGGGPNAPLPSAKNPRDWRSA